MTYLPTTAEDFEELMHQFRATVDEVLTATMKPVDGADDTGPLRGAIDAANRIRNAWSMMNELEVVDIDREDLFQIEMGTAELIDYAIARSHEARAAADDLIDATDRLEFFVAKITTVVDRASGVISDE